MTEQEAYGICADTLDAMSVGHGIVPLENFFYSEDDEIIKDFVSNVATSDGGDQSECSWPSRHLNDALASGRRWWQPNGVTPDVMEKFPGLKMLSERSIDVLTASGIAFPDKSRGLVEVGQSLGFGRCNIDSKIVGCISPRHRRWITHRCRLFIEQATVSHNQIITS